MHSDRVLTVYGVKGVNFDNAHCQLTLKQCCSIAGASIGTLGNKPPFKHVTHILSITKTAHNIVSGHGNVMHIHSVVTLSGVTLDAER